MQPILHTPLTPPESPTSWDAVRYWAGLATRFARASLACQVQAGFALRELRRLYTIRPGRPQKIHDPIVNFPDSPERPVTWPEILRREAGISHDTARNWIAMADALKRRWQALPVSDRLRQLMAVPPSDWAEDDTKLIADAVAKATTGRTQLDFLVELGITRRPDPAPVRQSRPVQDSVSDRAALLAEFRAEMRTLTLPLDDTLSRLPIHDLLAHQAEVAAYAARIAEILRSRKAHHD